MNVTIKEIKNIIYKTILEIDKPFSLQELFKKLKKQKILDIRITLVVLNEMLNSRVISYSEILSDNNSGC